MSKGGALDPHATGMSELNAVRANVAMTSRVLGSASVVPASAVRLMLPPAL
jgi:hypothetical protein